MLPWVGGTLIYELHVQETQFLHSHEVVPGNPSAVTWTDSAAVKYNMWIDEKEKVLSITKYSAIKCRKQKITWMTVMLAVYCSEKRAQRCSNHFFQILNWWKSWQHHCCRHNLVLAIGEKLIRTKLPINACEMYAFDCTNSSSFQDGEATRSVKKESWYSLGRNG